MIDFSKEIADLYQRIVNEIDSLLRHGGEVSWSDHEDGPTISANEGLSSVESVYNTNEKTYVRYTVSSTGGEEFCGIEDLLLEDVKNIYEAVYQKVMEEKSHG